MVSAPTSSPPKRGTIIVDGSVLLSLSQPCDVSLLPPEAGKEAPPPSTSRFLDLLVLLSRHGYDVVIPEMTAFKTADVLANGCVAHDLFFSGASSPRQSPVQEFLVDVGRKKYPGIRIMCAPEQAANEEYAKALATLHAPKLDKAVGRGCCMFLNTGRHEFETRSITDMVQHMPRENAPLFFLSNSHTHLQQAEAATADQNVTLGKVNLLGFFAALSWNHVLIPLGIDRGDSVFPFVNGTFAGDGHELVKTVDTNGPFLLGFSNHNNRALSMSMGDIAKDFDTEGPPLDPSRIVPRVSGADRFKTRFGSDWREKAGITPQTSDETRKR